MLFESSVGLRFVLLFRSEVFSEADEPPIRKTVLNQTLQCMSHKLTDQRALCFWTLPAKKIGIEIDADSGFARM